jgi:hypothetical protein
VTSGASSGRQSVIALFDLRGERLLPGRRVISTGDTSPPGVSVRLKIVFQTGGAATVCRRQQRAFSKPADAGHLLLDRLPQILQEVEAVGDLPRLWRAITCALRVQPAPIATHDLHFRVSCEDLCPPQYVVDGVRQMIMSTISTP